VLPPRHRMRHSADFGQATRSGSRGGSAHLVAHLRLAPRGSTGDPGPTPAEPARVGFVVSRAVGNAVVRNRVRRRLRGAVATRLDDLRPGSLVVIRALPTAATADYAELDASLEQAMRTATKRERSRASAAAEVRS
jgi:ribonuclease P protein component